MNEVSCLTTDRPKPSQPRPGQARPPESVDFEWTKTRKEQKKAKSKCLSLIVSPTANSTISVPAAFSSCNKCVYKELKNCVIFALRRVLSEIRPFQVFNPFQGNLGAGRLLLLLLGPPGSWRGWRRSSWTYRPLTTQPFPKVRRQLSTEFKNRSTSDVGTRLHQSVLHWVAN